MAARGDFRSITDSMSSTFFCRPKKTLGAACPSRTGTSPPSSAEITPNITLNSYANHARYGFCPCVDASIWAVTAGFSIDFEFWGYEPVAFQDTPSKRKASRKSYHCSSSVSVSKYDGSRWWYFSWRWKWHEQSCQGPRCYLFCLCHSLLPRVSRCACPKPWTSNSWVIPHVQRDTPGAFFLPIGSWNDRVQRPSSLCGSTELPYLPYSFDF